MKLRTLLITPLLLFIGLNAQPSSWNSLGHYSKPGAPIDMKYVTNGVDKNETADVNITLIPTVRSGIISVILTLDDKLTSLSPIEKELKFQIVAGQREYPIRLKVSSQEDGLYYIRLLTKIDKGRGSKMRAFAVPVTIGKGRKSNFNGNIMMKAHNGEHISVSRAVETIRVEKTK